MVGVPATNSTNTRLMSEQIVARRGNDWYAVFFNRYFHSYDDQRRQYTYYDTDWYAVKIGEGATKPSGFPTLMGRRYKIEQGATRVKLTDQQISSYGLSRPTRMEFGVSPKQLGWSADKGAAAREEGWDRLAIIPTASKEPSGSSGGDTGSGSSGDAANDEVAPPVRITVKGPPRFNPPLISYASGAWTPVLDTRPNRQPGEPLRESVPIPPIDRKRILGPDSDSVRVNQRGILLSDLTHSQDWVYAVEDNKENEESLAPNVEGGDDEPVDSGAEDGEAPTTLLSSRLNNDDSPEEGEESWEPRWVKDQNALENGVQYGFRFHYNPSTIAMGATINGELNPALILAGRSTWNPLGGLNNLGTVSFTLYLNRIEDMSFWKKVGSGYEWAGAVDVRNAYSGMMPGPKEREGIMTRGTEYDLEFLFRTILGRPFPTKLRGRTANLGMLWGTPCQLWLSRHMRYTGRVTSIAWSHRSFNRWMVPMWTEVTISFTRFPDAISALDAGETSTIGLIDGYPYDTALGYTLFDRENLGAEGWNTGGG